MEQALRLKAFYGRAYYAKAESISMSKSKIQEADERQNTEFRSQNTEWDKAASRSLFLF